MSKHDEIFPSLSDLVDAINAALPPVGNGCSVAFEAFQNHAEKMASVYIENLATGGAFLMEFYSNCGSASAVRVVKAAARAAWPDGGVPD